MAQVMFVKKCHIMLLGKTVSDNNLKYNMYTQVVWI